MGHPCSPVVVHKHQTYRPPSPHRGRCSAWSSRDASFSRPISSVSWLAHQLLVHKIGPVCRGQGETKEADHSRLEGGSFNKTGNIHMRLILADCIVRTHQNLKIYIEALTGFSHMFCADGLNNTLPLSKLHPWMAPAMGIVYRVYIPRTGEGVRSLWSPGSRLRVNWQSHPLDMT